MFTNYIRIYKTNTNTDQSDYLIIIVFILIVIKNLNSNKSKINILIISPRWQNHYYMYLLLNFAGKFGFGGLEMGYGIT